MPSPDSQVPRPGRDPASGSPAGWLTFFGIRVKFHFTFVLLAIFLIFVGISGQQSPASTLFYLVALFGSVFLHELGHGLTAKAYGYKTVELVMFPIGGISSLDRRPKPREDFWIALAGPAVNGAVALLVFAWLSHQGTYIPLRELAEATDLNLTSRIALGNMILALFNLLPAYPMDGGRILRSALGILRPEEEAGRLATAAGKLLAMVIGLYGLLSMNFFLVFIAFFVYLGALQEGLTVTGRTMTEGVPVRAAMITDFRTLTHGNTIRDAANLLLSTTQQDFPVLLGETVLGLLGRNSLLRAMATEGPDSYVASAMNRNFLRLDPEMPLSEAAPLLSQAGSCALVMEEDRLLGLLTSENVMEFVLLRKVGMSPTEAISR